MHKTKFKKNNTRKATWGQIWHQVRKIEILEKRLSPAAQNDYADLEDTCRDKVTQVGVIVRYTKNVIGKIQRLGSKLTPSGRLRVKHNIKDAKVKLSLTILKVLHDNMSSQATISPLLKNTFPYRTYVGYAIKMVSSPVF